uniref:Uncharacterized protein n=1 Tax=Meloidogyne incognita TaxID=6306 RepID=A0A914LFH6_MELIC
MTSPDLMVKDWFDKTQNMPNVSNVDFESQDNFVEILECFVRILKPPSPQPINRQIETFARYVELLSRFKRSSLHGLD